MIHRAKFVCLLLWNSRCRVHVQIQQIVQLSYPLPFVSVSQEKKQIDTELEESFETSECTLWKGDHMEKPPASGSCRLGSFNANGHALVHHTELGNSIWNKLHALGVSAVAIQDTRLQNPDMQIAAQKQASMFTEGAQTTYS